jgi:hypothetical protein
MAVFAAHMTTLYQQIGEKILAELEKSKDVSSQRLEALRPLFAEGKKVRPDDLVKIFFGRGRNISFPKDTTMEIGFGGQTATPISSSPL